MCDCHYFVALGSELLLNLRHTDGPAKVSSQLVNLCSVSLKANAQKSDSRQRAARETSNYVRTSLRNHRRNILR